MERLTVKSSKIASIGYDAKKEVFEVEMKTGILFRHQHVPPHFWKECLLAKSIGKYYFNNIRDTFPFEMGRMEIQEEEE